MKLKIAEILGANEALTQLGELSLPISTSVKVARLQKKVGDEAAIHLELRNNLIKKYGKLSKEKQGQIEVPPNKIAEYLGELNELLTQEVDVDWPKLTLPEEGVNVKPNVLAALLDLIENKEGV